MRKIIGLVIIFLALQGCGSSGCTVNYLAIVNNSGKDFEISSYRKFSKYDTPTFSKKIIITNNSKYGQTFKDCGNERATKFDFGALVQGDSIVIDYGDKTKSYGIHSFTDERDPYYLRNQDKSNDFVYILTPEDYANAIPKL